MPGRELESSMCMCIVCIYKHIYVYFAYTYIVTCIYSTNISGIDFVLLLGTAWLLLTPADSAVSQRFLYSIRAAVCIWVW